MVDGVKQDTGNEEEQRKACGSICFLLNAHRIHAKACFMQSRITADTLDHLLSLHHFRGSGLTRHLPQQHEFYEVPS